jgi:hypothetical protein
MVPIFIDSDAPVPTWIKVVAIVALLFAPVYIYNEWRNG